MDQQINPDNAAFRDLCAALRALSRTAPEHPLVSTAITATSASALALVRRTTFTPELANAVLASLQLSLLDAFEEKHPREMRHYLSSGLEFQHICDQLYAAKSTFIIALVDRMGAANPLDDIRFLDHVMDRDDPKLFSAAAKDSAFAPFTGNITRNYSAILRCGPRIAPQLANSLLSAVSAGGEAFRALSSCPMDVADLKFIAALALSGVDLSSKALSGSESSEGYRQIRNIMDNTASSHGRLCLHSREPSLACVLGRGFEDMFFGIKAQKLAA